MNDQHSRIEPSTPESGLESLAELFHLVRSLVPAGQQVTTASPSMSVAQAIRLMLKNNFSQLPVVEGKAVLGVFSFRSLARTLLKMERLPQDLGELPVDEFREQFHFVQPPDNWEEILDDLGRDDGVLVGHRELLEGILTPLDVLLYLRDIASPFVMLAEIELSLRRIIQGCVSEEDLQSCIVASLSSKYSPEELPRSLSDMTFNDYVQVIERSDTWPYFEDALGRGEWSRKRTSSRLREIRDLRNDVFHFRRALTEDDRELLAERREWLRMKTRAFEARKAASGGPSGEKSADAEGAPSSLLRAGQVTPLDLTSEDQILEEMGGGAGQQPSGPLQAMMGKVRKSIGSEATERLARFMDRVRSLGVSTITNPGSVSFRLRLRVAPELGGKVKPTMTTLLWLAPDADRAFLRLATGELGAALGDEARQYIARFQSLGAEEVLTSWALELRLCLNDHNEQPMFDQLFAIVRDVATEVREAAQRKSVVQPKLDSGEAQLSGAARSHHEFWTDVLGRFKEQRPGVTDKEPTTRSYLQVPVGSTQAHLEWAVHGQTQASRWLEVALHMEHSDKEANLRALNWLEVRKERLEDLVGEPLKFEEWGSRWARVYARRGGREQDAALRDWAVETMVRFYDALQGLELAARLKELGW
jgi:CBS domain-containing protein